MAGYDTANYVYDVSGTAVSDYGTPNFWLRYFSPSNNTPINSSSSNANEECTAIYNSGGNHLGPIMEPNQSNLSSSSAQGQADAQTFVSALNYVYDNVTPLMMPTNDQLYCWLGQEPSTSLSSSYWDGWSGYVGSNSSFGGEFLYPCLYCTPCAPAPNCSSVLVQYHDTAYNTCIAIWAAGTKGWCQNTNMSDPPPWQAETCAGCGVNNNVPTSLWQYNIGGECGIPADLVDEDYGAPGFNYPDYCFFMDYS
jgi:hypothetical protein